MSEFDEVSNVIVSETGKAANIIMGIILDDAMAGKIQVTIIATGLEKEDKEHTIDFPGLPEFGEKSVSSITQPEDTNAEIEDIFARLSINQTTPKEEVKAAANEPTRIPPLKTDVPSFLKALD